MITKELIQKRWFINPAEEVLYLRNPIDGKLYNVYDWTWMIDEPRDMIANFINNHDDNDTFDGIFNNPHQKNPNKHSDVARKLHNYIIVQPAFISFCFPKNPI